MAQSLRSLWILMKMYMCWEVHLSSLKQEAAKGVLFILLETLLTLVFDYTVQTEHNTNDLDYAGNNALKLNGGSIKDIVTIDANLILPIVNTLKDRKDIRIDNIPPQITQSSINNNGNIPVLYNSKIIYTVSEKVQSADLNMISALGDIVNGTLSVMNANQSSSVDLDLLAPFTSGDAIQVTIENLTDLAGNVSKTLNMNTMYPL